MIKLGVQIGPVCPVQVLLVETKGLYKSNEINSGLAMLWAHIGPMLPVQVLPQAGGKPFNPLPPEGLVEAL